MNLRVPRQPTRHEPVRCQCTPHRRVLVGKGLGRWAARVKCGVDGWYNQGCYQGKETQGYYWSSAKVVDLTPRLIRPSNSNVSAQRWERKGVDWSVFKKKGYWSLVINQEKKQTEIYYRDRIKKVRSHCFDRCVKWRWWRSVLSLPPALPVDFLANPLRRFFLVVPFFLAVPEVISPSSWLWLPPGQPSPPLGQPLPIWTAPGCPKLWAVLAAISLVSLPWSPVFEGALGPPISCQSVRGAVIAENAVTILKGLLESPIAWQSLWFEGAPADRARVFNEEDECSPSWHAARPSPLSVAVANVGARVSSKG